LDDGGVGLMAFVRFANEKSGVAIMVQMSATKSFVWSFTFRQD
jgi:hypothetical protein